mgnify:CR=1 FL=1
MDYGHTDPKLDSMFSRSSMSMTPSLLVSPEQEAGQSSHEPPSPSQVPPSAVQSSLLFATQPEETQQAPVGGSATGQLVAMSFPPPEYQVPLSCSGSLPQI